MAVRNYLQNSSTVDQNIVINKRNNGEQKCRKKCPKEPMLC